MNCCMNCGHGIELGLFPSRDLKSAHLLLDGRHDTRGTDFDRR